MGSLPWSLRLGRHALAAILVLGLSGCMGMGGSGRETPAAAEETAAAEATPATEEIDPRRYIGPDYCPELRIREGTELLRRYEAGHEDDPAYVVWQASIGKTARECLYDLQGTLTLRVGVSGRVVTGPKGSPGATVSLPLRIAVVKFQESVLASQLFPLSIAIPAANSAVFTEVHEIIVPSPGQDRDYIIYVGLDEAGKRLLGEKEEPVPEVVKPPVKRAQRRATRRAAPAQAARPAQPAPSQSTTPNVLPLPSEGFVLSQ